MAKELANRDKNGDLNRLRDRAVRIFEEVSSLRLPYPIKFHKEVVIPPYLGDIKSRKVKPPWLISVLV